MVNKSLKIKMLKAMGIGAVLFSLCLVIFPSLWVMDAGAESKTCQVEAQAIPNFQLATEPISLSEAEIATLDGEPITLTHYSERVVVLNHWAIWCAPCIHEMPTFTSLSTKTKDMPAIVIPVSMDRAGPQKVADFVQRQGWDNAVFLSDKSMKLGREYRVTSIPATQIFARNGQEFGRLLGPYVWDKPEVVKLITCLANA